MSYDTEEWRKIRRKTDKWFGKMPWVIWQIFTRSLKSLTIGTLMGSFSPKQKMYKLKICHDDEEWCKIWRGTAF